MATVLSAALESFPYNSEINNDLCQDSWTTRPHPGPLTEHTLPYDDGQTLQAV